MCVVGSESELSSFGATESSLITLSQSGGQIEVQGASLDGSESTSVGTVPGRLRGDQFVHGGQLYFTVETGEGAFTSDPIELWASDGSAVTRLANLGFWDFFGTGVTTEFQAVGNEVLLNVTQGFADSATSSLWISDGTAEGTAEYADGFTGVSRGINKVEMVSESWVFDGQQGNDPDPVFGLWTTNPADRTVAQVQTFQSPVSELTSTGVDAYFAASGDGGNELWKTDGTPGGTLRLTDINPTGDSSPGDLTAVGDLVFFTADNGVNGRELWVSDGTEAGTSLVEDITSEGSTSFSGFYPVAELLLFTVQADGQTELWSSDGTKSGTGIVTILEGRIETFTTNTSEPVSVGDLLFFVTGDAAAGTELWVTDGTLNGTSMAVDINPGEASANPSRLTITDDSLLFLASSESAKDQLWSVDLEVIGAQTELLDGDVNGDGSVDVKDFLILSRNFGQEVSGRAEGDFDGDGLVQIFDFLVISRNFGRVLR